MTSAPTIIVATDQANGIGLDNKIPWKLREDLAHFRDTTMGACVIMGRKTRTSLNRELPGRRNIVLTRRVSVGRKEREIANSLEEALLMAGDQKVFIIGGAEVYRQAIDLCNELIVTRIAKTYACDTFFPVLDPEIWREVRHRRMYADYPMDCSYSIINYQRRTPI